MKTKITVLIGAIALATLSFTFANVDSEQNRQVQEASVNHQTPVGGLLADEVSKD